MKLYELKKLKLRGIMENINIKIGDRALNFLLYLINIKQFDAISLWRVLDRPDQNNRLYEQYLKFEERKNVIHKK